MKILNNLKLLSTEKKPFLADVYFEADGHSKPCVIFNHGFKGFKDWGIWHLVAQEFARAGFVFIKFNQSHNGTTIENPESFDDLEAFGRNTYTRELHDLKTVFLWAMQNEHLPEDLIDKERISIFGHSRGGGTAILYAHTEPRVHKLITWAAFKSIGERLHGTTYEGWQQKKVVYIPNARTKQEMPQYYEIKEDYLKHEEAFGIQTAAKELKQDWFIVHGTEDPTVHFNDALALKNCNKSAELFLVPNANHVFGGSHPFKGNALPADAQLATSKSIDFLK